MSEWIDIYQVISWEMNICQKKLNWEPLNSFFEFVKRALTWLLFFHLMIYFVKKAYCVTSVALKKLHKGFNSHIFEYQYHNQPLFKRNFNFNGVQEPLKTFWHRNENGPQQHLHFKLYYSSRRIQGLFFDVFLCLLLKK